MTPRLSINTQILALRDKGLSPIQIANALTMEVEVIDAILGGFNANAREKKSTMRETYPDMDELIVNTLRDVCMDQSLGGSRVLAAKTLRDIMDNEEDAKVGKFEFDPLKVAEALSQINDRKKLIEQTVESNIVNIQAQISEATQTTETLKAVSGK
jgi:hypothetical protein